MIHIALYGNNEKLLDEIIQKLTTGLYSKGHEFMKIDRITYFQTSLFDDMVDLYIIEITKEPEKGITFARDVKLNPHAEILFIAEDEKYAMTAFHLDAIGYVTVPLEIKRLLHVILRYFAPRPSPYESLFSFKTSTGLHVLPAERIAFIEYTNHKMNINLDTGKIIETSTMRHSFSTAAEQILNSIYFIRTHASFIVNVLHVRELNANFITLDTKDVVPVSHSKLPAVRKYLSEFFKNYNKTEQKQ